MQLREVPYLRRYAAGQTVSSEVEMFQLGEVSNRGWDLTVDLCVTDHQVHQVHEVAELRGDSADSVAAA